MTLQGKNSLILRRLGSGVSRTNHHTRKLYWRNINHCLHLYALLKNEKNHLNHFQQQIQNSGSLLVNDVSVLLTNIIFTFCDSKMNEKIKKINHWDFWARKKGSLQYNVISRFGHKLSNKPCTQFLLRNVRGRRMCRYWTGQLQNCSLTRMW